MTSQYQSKTNEKRAEYMIRNGDYSRAKQQLRSHGVAPINTDTITKLQTLQ